MPFNVTITDYSENQENITTIRVQNAVFRVKMVTLAKFLNTVHRGCQHRVAAVRLTSDRQGSALYLCTPF